MDNQVKFTLSQLLQLAAIITVGAIGWATLKTDIGIIKIVVTGLYTKAEIDKFRSDADNINNRQDREIARMLDVLALKPEPMEKK